MSVKVAQLLRVLRLVQQDVQRRKIGVPLDQGWRGAHATERRSVQLPDRLRYPGAVVVDQNVFDLGGVMAGEVELTDRVRRQRIDIPGRVEPEISRADIDVVDLSQEAAAGSARGFGQEFHLGDGGMAKA